VSDHLVIRVQILQEATPDWVEQGFKLGYRRPSDDGLPILRLIILKGIAQQSSYQFTKPVINIGRAEEAKDKYGVLQLRNDLVFADLNNEINRTLSRRHAKIEYNKQSREYRIFDQQSKHGTRLERDGRFLEVTGPLGLGVCHGDVLHLGQARLKVEIFDQQDAQIIQ
jgi:pSer/pThr/pTyr-binding forkhead associated (FHA) protein